MKPRFPFARYALITLLLAIFVLGIYVILSSNRSKKTSAPTPSTVPVPAATPTMADTVVIMDAEDEEDAEEEEEEGDDQSSHGSVQEEGEDEDMLDEVLDEEEGEDDNGASSAPPTDPTQCPDVLIRQGNSLLLYNSRLPKKDGENPIQFNSLDDYIYYIKVQRYTKNQYCPVLYLQQENDAQGNDVYRVRPGPFNQQAGLPVTPTVPPSMVGLGGPLPGSNVVPPAPFNRAAAHPLQKSGSSVQVVQQGLAKHPPLVPYVDANYRAPFNQGYHGFDPMGQYIGKYTILDQIHNSTKSQNPKTGLSSNPMDPNWAGIVFMTQPTNVGSNAAPNATVAPYSQTASTVLDYTTLSSVPTPAATTLAPGKDDPMNVNWVGAQASRADVNAGAYANNNVLIRTA